MGYGLETVRPGSISHRNVGDEPASALGAGESPNPNSRPGFKDGPFLRAIAL